MWLVNHILSLLVAPLAVKLKQSDRKLSLNEELSEPQQIIWLKDTEVTSAKEASLALSSRCEKTQG